MASNSEGSNFDWASEWMLRFAWLEFNYYYYFCYYSDLLLSGFSFPFYWEEVISFYEIVDPCFEWCVPPAGKVDSEGYCFDDAVLFSAGA